MYLSRLCTAGALASLVLIGGALAGEHLHAHRIKTCTPDGVCYPSRQTYGFYQTQWRRWPGAELEADQKANAKPTKAKSPLPPPSPPSTQDTLPGGDLPGDALNDRFPLPGDDSDTMPEPPRDTAPFDTEPALPGDTRNKLEQPSRDTDLRNLLNDEDGVTPPNRDKSSEPEQDTSPEMPGDAEEDDPFKDELIPGDPNNDSSRRLPVHANERAESMRWRTAPSLAAKAAALDALDSAEPELLHANSEQQNTLRKGSFAAHANPLRPAMAVAKPKPVRRQSVVPTADWSAQADETPAANAWRSNPLRNR